MTEAIQIYNEQGRAGLMFFLSANYSGKTCESKRAELMKQLTGQAPRRVEIVHLENALINYILTPKLF